MLMLSEPQRDLVRDKGTVFGRVLIGLLFFATGLSMLLVNGPAGSAMYFESMGVPAAGFVVWLVMAVKIVGGGAIVLGKRVGLAAAVLIGFTVLATLVAHVSPFDETIVLKNLAIIGGLLYLMAYGPGGSNTHSLTTDHQEG